MADFIGILKIAVYILLPVLGVIILLKTCETELRDFKQFFHELTVAALHELTFKGGRAAKSNIVLSVILAVLFVFISLPGELREFRDIWDGTSESGNAKYFLFGCLGGFFSLSLCFVVALEIYSRRTGGNNT